MQFPIMLDSVQYREKPKGAAGAIKSRLATTCANPLSLSPDALREFVEHGGTFCPAIIRPTTNEKGALSHNAAGFAAQQVFCVDIDNDEQATVDGKKQKRRLPDGEYIESAKALEICEACGVAPFMMYHSFSSSPYIEKYRICVALPDPITDDTEREHVVSAFVSMFGRATDSSCTNADRIFFGSGADSVFMFNPDAVTQKSAFLDLWELTQQQQSGGAEPPDTIPDTAPARSAPATAPPERDSRFDADPVTLLNMIDPNGLTYSEWQKITGAFINSGGSRSDWDAWCSRYADNSTRENERVWNSSGKSGKHGKATIATLKHAAGEAAPAEYENYMNSLKEAQREARKAQKPKHITEPPPQDSKTNDVPKGYHLLTYSDGTTFPAPLWITTTKAGGLKLSPVKLEKAIRDKYSIIYTKSSDISGKSVYMYYPENGFYRYADSKTFAALIKSMVDAFNANNAETLDNYGKALDETVKLLNIYQPANTYRPERLDSSETLLNCTNGMIDIESGKILKHSPKFFSTMQLNIEYDPSKHYTLSDAPVFAGYIDHLTAGDAERKALLLEYAGAIFSNVDGSRYKRILYLVGAGDSGKSQYVRLIASIIGEDFAASTDFTQLDSRFRNALIVGKRFVYDPDLADSIAIGNRTVMQYTGGDNISIERKGQEPFDYKGRGFMCVCSNEMPRTRGNLSQAYYNRLLICSCPNAVQLEKQDKFLLAKMLKEKNAIVSICLDAFKQTISRNYRFTVPQDNSLFLSELRAENDSAAEFFADYCKLYENAETDGAPYEIGDFYKVFCDWFSKYYPHRTPTTSRAFYHRICDFYGIPEYCRKSHGKRICYITLTQEGKNELRPGSQSITINQNETTHESKRGQI